MWKWAGGLGLLGKEEEVPHSLGPTLRRYGPALTAASVIREDNVNGPSEGEGGKGQVASSCPRASGDVDLLWRCLCLLLSFLLK